MKLRTLTTLAVSALTISASLGIELLDPIPLPDLGFGSEANGSVDWGDGTGVCGSVRDAMGRNLPFLWDLDNDGVVVGASPLPMPTGFQGGCQKTLEFASGHAVAVGTLIAPNGTQHAVLWRKTPAGNWGMPTPLLPYIEQSNISSDPDAGCGDTVTMYAAVNGLDAGGVWHAGIASITDGTSNTVFLPSIGGRSAMCLGLREPDESGNLEFACGWVQAPNGLRKPAAWDLDNDGQYKLNLLQTPQNVSGMARSIAVDDGLWHVVGELSRNGRTQAAEWDLNNDGLLRPLEGYLNSSAYNLGDTGTHEVGHIVFGRSSNPGELPVATAWQAGPVHVQYMLQDPSSVGQVLGYSWGANQTGSFGSIIPAGGGPAQAAAFRVTDDNVPSIIAILIGLVQDSRPQQLWHDDGDTLRVRTKRANGIMQAMVDFTLVPLDKSIVSYEWDFDYNGTAHLESNRPNAAGDMQILAYCFDHHVYEPLGSTQLTRTPSQFSISGHETTHGYHDPVTGEACVRLHLSIYNNNPVALALDSLRLTLH